MVFHRGCCSLLRGLKWISVLAIFPVSAHAAFKLQVPKSLQSPDAICELLLRVGAQPDNTTLGTWYPGLSAERVREIYSLIPSPRMRLRLPTIEDDEVIEPEIIARLPHETPELIDLALDLSVIERTDQMMNDPLIYRPGVPAEARSASLWKELVNVWYRAALQISAQRVSRIVSQVLSERTRDDIDPNRLLATLIAHRFRGDDDLIDQLTGVIHRPNPAVRVGIGEGGNRQLVNWATAANSGDTAAIIPTWADTYALLTKLKLQGGVQLVEPMLISARTAYLINRIYPDYPYIGTLMKAEDLNRVAQALAPINPADFHLRTLGRLPTPNDWLPEVLDGSVVLLPDLRDPLGLGGNRNNSSFLEHRLYADLILRLERNEYFFMIAYWNSYLERALIAYSQKYPDRIKVTKNDYFFPFTIFQSVPYAASKPVHEDEIAPVLQDEPPVPAEEVRQNEPLPKSVEDAILRAISGPSWHDPLDPPRDPP